MDSSNSGEGSSMKKDISDCKNYTKTHNMIRWKSGKRVDPRLLALLESFEEIYAARHELFKKIFHEDHHELFKKIGDALKRKKQMKKVRSLPRSMSMRDIGNREINENIRNERFKIKPPKVIVAEPDDKN